jgi:hypothetical protein
MIKTRSAELGKAATFFALTGRCFMQGSPSLRTAEILAEFTDEVAARQGRVTDTFDDGRRLFTRSVVPRIESVKPGDKLQGGVALKATEEGVCVYPYVFRQVCRNGAIMAQTIDVRPVDLHLLEPDNARQAIREAVGACCDVGVFAETVGRMRNGCASGVDFAITILPMIAQLSGQVGSEIASKILNQFFRDGGQSRFGLANAITAIARDTRDPDLRSDLEEFGGGVAIGRVPTGPIPGKNAAARRKRAVLVS